MADPDFNIEDILSKLGGGSMPMGEPVKVTPVANSTMKGNKQLAINAIAGILAPDTVSPQTLAMLPLLMDLINYCKQENI